MHKKIQDSYLKREGDNPGISGLPSHPYMVVPYPRTVWKNSYVEHKVTGKIYNLKKQKLIDVDMMCFISPPNVYMNNTWLVPGITI